MTPRATYRLQLNRDFTFADAERTVPYLARLGVSHLYASPILTARPGSPHGYDVIDPSRVNPELGGEDGLRALVDELRRAELGLIVDIVPNHMYAGAGNEWWRDVLRHGRESTYANFFDIDWKALGGKLLLPILGKPLGDALSAGEIAVDGDNIRYFDHILPVAPGTASGGNLSDLLDLQHYRLAWWRTAADEVNWRRFFDINDLVALRVEDPDVFEATHATLFRLFADGLIDGFRVDHIDGLADPGAYCRALRARLAALRARRAYLMVEKILRPNERLPRNWGTDGTVGYDFMNEVSGVLHDPAGAAPLSRQWNDIVGHPTAFEAEEERAREEILARCFAAPLEALVRGLTEAAQRDLATRDFTAPALRRCVTALLLQLRVYRTYPGETENNVALFDRAVERAAIRGFSGDREAMTWLGARLGPPSIDGVWARLQTTFQQLSAPLAAKAVEDTAFYRYGRLLSRNDVGFDAAQFALPPTAFHAAMAARHANFPLAMLATATHDHKRGEDVRARLAVLSEIPYEWTSAVTRCRAANAGLQEMVGGAPVPNLADEAMLYQTIVGAWPPELSVEDRDGRRAFAERLARWQGKAMREAKLATNWIVPNRAYEEASVRFLGRLFADAGEGLRILAGLAYRIGRPGAINGLTQTVLKLTAPGVPDFYQGTEFWDLSLVDPDNRQQVNFGERMQAIGRGASPTSDLRTWPDARLKQAVIARLLALRRAAPDLFALGDYVPVYATGAAADCVVGFCRRDGATTLCVLVTRFPCRLLEPDDTFFPAAQRWQDTTLLFPGPIDDRPFRSMLVDRAIQLRRETLVSSVLAELPVAVLISD